MSDKKEEKSLNENKSSIKNLLQSVRAIFNIKNILSHLTIIKRLKLIYFNKQLQNKSGIDSELYKTTSGRYKIGKKEGQEKNIY